MAILAPHYEVHPNLCLEEALLEHAARAFDPGAEPEAEARAQKTVGDLYVRSGS